MEKGWFCRCLNWKWSVGLKWLEYESLLFEHWDVGLNFQEIPICLSGMMEKIVVLPSDVLTFRLSSLQYYLFILGFKQIMIDHASKRFKTKMVSWSDILWYPGWCSVCWWVVSWNLLEDADRKASFFFQGIGGCCRSDDEHWGADPFLVVLPLKTNISPENWWLEDIISLSKDPFSGNILIFRGIFRDSILWKQHDYKDSRKFPVSDGIDFPGS